MGASGFEIQKWLNTNYFYFLTHNEIELKTAKNHSLW